MSREKEDMERLPLAGGTIEYTDRGTGQPILLVHAGVFADWFLPLAASPVLEGFRVIRMRRAGYASGSPPPAHLSIAAHAGHCAGLLDTLGVEQAHVVGHSSSALIAVELAADRPHLVRSLALTNLGQLDLEDQHLPKAMDRFAQAVRGVLRHRKRLRTGRRRPDRPPS